VPHPFLNLAYPSSGADYDRVFNTLVAAFPEIEVNRGRPLAFRWRCMPCGPREIQTQTDATRYLLGADGPVPFLKDWEYRAGFSQASSEGKSKTGTGYHYWQPLADLINSGTLSPFSLTQTPAALSALNAISASGVTIYGGKYTMTQTDASMSGPVFALPAGTMMAAVGVDVRTEKYRFDGDQRPNANTVGALIFNAPFDNALATAGTLKRDIKAVYGELLVPVIQGLELTLATRMDDYTGFGRTTNPKVSLKYTPTESFLVRAAYSEGFRVPTFKQVFDPATISTYTGNDLTDPATCPTRAVSSLPGCAAITPGIAFGGRNDLNPETAKMKSLGFVYAPNGDFSANVDWWEVQRDGTIQDLGLTTFVNNYQLFPERFIRASDGSLSRIDRSWVNAGKTETAGMEVGMRSALKVGGGRLTGAFDVSYLLKKRSKLVASAPFGPSEVGVFTRASDLGIRWKHTLTVGYSEGPWAGTLTQVYRGRYADFVLPGVANGSVRPPNWNPIVEPYEVWNMSIGYSGFKNLNIVAGVKNLFNTDPPFSVTYDTNTGAGSSWEPRVADPRGRAYTLRVEYKFW
jgi:iron complex outermembrane receptor protein